MICTCGKKFRVLNVVSATDVSKRRVCCEGCGREAYSVEQIYAERSPRPAMYKGVKRSKQSAKAQKGAR